jgi:RNA polymerase sigma-70 factor (ECF subfamily)
MVCGIAMTEILQIFLKNEHAIRRHMMRFCRSADDIDEILQETFLRGFAAETQGTIKEPKAYLFQIAKNLALDKLRKKTSLPIESLEETGGSSLILDEDQAAADALLDGRRKLALFAKAVAQLPPQCRKAFLFRHVNEYSYKQIASRMNISVSAVEKHVTIALVKCEQFLRANGYDASEFGASHDYPAAVTNFSLSPSTPKVMAERNE